MNMHAEGGADVESGICLWFDGIIEGPRGEVDGLQQMVQALNGVGSVRFSLDVDGGRFSLLADDEVFHQALSDSQREHLVTALQALLDRLSEGAEIESTLRCSELHDDVVDETLFGVVGQRLKVVSRSRPMRPEDRQHLARSPDSALATLLPGDRRLLPIIAVLMLAVVVFFAWQSGAVDRVFSPAATTLAQDDGPFADLLTMAVESSWGNYSVTITRGPAYPDTPQAVAAQLESAATTARRAATNVVANGDMVFIRLEADDGRVVLARPVSLRSLVSRSDAEVTVTIPGHMAGRRLQLALDDGRP